MKKVPLLIFLISTWVIPFTASYGAEIPSVSLNLFDAQNAKAENAVSEFGSSEDELINLVQVAARKLLGMEVAEEKAPEKAAAGVTPPLPARPFTDPVTGMEFVFIKGGCFEMGDTFGDGSPDEKPVHEVCLEDFHMGKYEVTQGQWEIVMGNYPSRFKERDRPVEQVSWSDVQQFINRLNDQSGRKFRLPTEAEWEYAARSGGKREKYAGTSQEGDLGQYAWYFVNSGSQTHPVGERRPNGLGLYDMSGNVWEWCADWYGENYYKGTPKNNPEGPFNGSYRVLRGGSWFHDPENVRATYRYCFSPAYRGGTIGFRLGLSAR
jgi:formylglycine-generating enzyme required for sulfatase activity